VALNEGVSALDEVCAWGLDELQACLLLGGGEYPSSSGCGSFA